LAEARREANDILARAQKVAQESRDADIAATRDELERMRVRATAEIEAEKTRAIADLRGEVADLALAAAGRVVGETMSDDRSRRLVQEFLATADTTGDRGN
jgi:F-type H+-transporting ATPase subunit b